MNYSPKVIIHNGPPSSGKDVASKAFVEYMNNTPHNHNLSVIHREFKGQLFKLTKLIYNISDEQWDEWYTRDGKEIPREKLNGKSCREALIHTSETVIKPNFGSGYFGEYAAKYDADVVTFSDGGFVGEIAPLIAKYGRDNVLVVRIHRDGFDFGNDSRSYLPDGIVTHMVDVYNKMPLENNDEEFEDFKTTSIFVDTMFVTEQFESEAFLNAVRDIRSNVTYQRFDI